MRAALLYCAGFAVLLAACDDGPKKSAPAPATSGCTTFGQSCEYSPGKLGTCVQKDNCTKDCFVCQSQH